MNLILKYIKLGKNINDKYNGKTILAYLLIYGCDIYKSIIYYLCNNNVDTNAVDDIGNSILFYAINSRCNFSIIDKLLQNRANPNIIDMTGRNIIDHAIALHSDSTIIELLKTYIVIK